VRLTARSCDALYSFARPSSCAVLPAIPPVGADPPLRIYRWEKTTVVAVKIKLKRLGKIREPYYRIVVADARTKRDGRAIEEIGKYHPKAEPSFIQVNSERVQHWLSVGAQPTDPVRVLLKITGDWQKFTGEPGAEGTLRTAAPRADKKERFEAAAKDSQARKEAKEDKGGKAGTQSRATKPAKETTAKDTTAKETPAKQAASGEDKSGQPKATETKATDAKATATATETKATATETKATDTETKATDTKATDTKATDTKATEAKATDAKAPEAKTTDAKATDVKATEAKADAPAETVSQDAPAADVEVSTDESGSGA